jgi:hypothetical protein
MKRFNAISMSLFLLFSVFAAGCDVTVTVEELGTEMGSLVVTNDIDWSDVSTSFVSATITGDGYTATFDDAGIATGFSATDLPVGDYTVTITDDMDVSYVITEVPVEVDSESTLSVVITDATSGAINLTNSIDNLDGDEVFVVGLYATNPNENVVDLAAQLNWLEGAQVGFDQAAIAIGVAAGSYHLILADMDDNYYLKTDIVVGAGAVTDVTVTQSDRDEDLTQELNE